MKGTRWTHKRSSVDRGDTWKVLVLILVVIRISVILNLFSIYTDYSRYRFGPIKEIFRRNRGEPIDLYHTGPPLWFTDFFSEFMNFPTDTDHTSHRKKTKTQSAKLMYFADMVPRPVSRTALVHFWLSWAFPNGPVSVPVTCIWYKSTNTVASYVHRKHSNFRKRALLCPLLPTVDPGIFECLDDGEWLNDSPSSLTMYGVLISKLRWTIRDWVSVKHYFSDILNSLPW